MADRAPISTTRLDLILLTPITLDGLLSEGLAAVDGVALPAGWLSQNAPLLRMRRDQIARDPEQAIWLLRLVVLRDTRDLVGHIGFHGAPGSNAQGATDAVELGYSIEPAFRRRGFAEEAVRGMIGWARARSISRFLVSVSPTNAPSLALAGKLGFREVTRVVDDEDGPEIVLELRT